MLSSTIPVGAAQFNPFTGDTDGSPLSPKRARKTQSGLDSLPPLPLAAPVVVGLPVAGATGQGGGLVGQDKKNTYKIAGTVDGEVVVLDNMNSMFILKNGEIFDGCVVNDPFIDCTPQAYPREQEDSGPGRALPVQSGHGQNPIRTSRRRTLILSCFFRP